MNKEELLIYQAFLFGSYTQALALKELGFDEPCFGEYHYGKLKYDEIYNTQTEFHSDLCLAPTYSQAFRWFREKYQLHSTITSISQESWQWHITKPGEFLGKLYEEDFYTYEEAEKACLDKLIEIVKNK